MDLVSTEKWQTPTGFAEPAAQGWLRRSVIFIVNACGGEWAGVRRATKRHMRLIETLPLGAKKQLLLVACDGERFLIGTGPESVQSILRVRPQTIAEDSSNTAEVGV